MSSELSSQIRNASLALLARREHSQHELRQKLLQRFPGSAVLIQEVLNGVASDGYQSDSRFVEAYIRSRSNKGYGRQRLSQELRLRGVDIDLVDAAFAEIDCNDRSLDQLLRLWRKKFKVRPVDAKEKFRQTSFFRYRGFSSVEVEALFVRLQHEEL